MKNIDAFEEMNKCLEDPYYFATKYLKVNGKPFTTMLNREEFNSQFFYLQKIANNKKLYLAKTRGRL